MAGLFFWYSNRSSPTSAAGKKLAGWSWAYLLQAQPQFADKCRWSSLNGYAWAHLLGKRPQFAESCNWRKLDRRDLDFLLQWQPQLANKCRWNELNNECWLDLLRKLGKLEKLGELRKLRIPKDFLPASLIVDKQIPNVYNGDQIIRGWYWRKQRGWIPTIL